MDYYSLGHYKQYDEYSGPGRVMLSPTMVFFRRRYEQIKNEIEIHPRWINGNGYFPEAVMESKPHRAKLYPGEIAKATHTSGRKMIFIGTKAGTIVVFERYSSGTPLNFVTFNAADKITDTHLVSFTDMLKENTLKRIIGDGVEPPHIVALANKLA